MINSKLMQIVELNENNELICKFYYAINNEIYSELPENIRNKIKINFENKNLKTIQDYMIFFKLSDKMIEEIYFNIKLFQTGQNKNLAKETFNNEEMKFVIHMILSFCSYLFIEEEDFLNSENISHRCKFENGFTLEARAKLLGTNNVN